METLHEERVVRLLAETGLKRRTTPHIPAAAAVAPDCDEMHQAGGCSAPECGRRTRNGGRGTAPPASAARDGGDACCSICSNSLTHGKAGIGEQDNTPPLVSTYDGQMSLAQHRVSRPTTTLTMMQMMVVEFGDE